MELKNQSEYYNILDIGSGSGENSIYQSMKFPKSKIIACETFVDGNINLCCEIFKRNIHNILIYNGNVLELFDTIVSNATTRITYSHPIGLPIILKIFLFIIYANGLILQKVLINSHVINLNFFEQSIIGLIGTGFVALLLNFFFPLNDLIIYLNLFIGLIFIFFFKDRIKFNYNKSSRLFIILFFFLSLANIYGSGFSDDLNHYHGGYITNTDNHNYIIGLNFLHHHYGYSSIWLILHSYLNINNLFLQDIHVLNGIIFFLLIAFLSSSLNLFFIFSMFSWDLIFSNSVFN